MTFRRVFLLPAILLAMLLGACGNSTAQALPRLDDPKEIIEEALRTTAELEFVHARARGRPGSRRRIPELHARR